MPLIPLKDDWITGNTFTADDANDVAVAVNAMGARIVTPEDFGAVGDGTTNDTDALDEMFNSYTVNNGGSCILIPYGKVYLTDALDIKDNTFVFGSGTLKCRSDDGGSGAPGAFMMFKNGVNNVTWMGPTLDCNNKLNVNGFDLGNIDSDDSSPYIENIRIHATVMRTRISEALEDTNAHLYAGGGKGISVSFRTRNIYGNIIADDCDIGCSVETTVNLNRPSGNVILDILSRDSHRTALFIGGDLDAGSSLDSAGFNHSKYPGVKIRLTAHDGQDASITQPVTNVVGTNYDHAGIVTMNYASGVDLDVYAATPARCTLLRGMAIASTFRIKNALLDEMQDGWDTRPIDTLDPGFTFMPDNVFEANIHAYTHHGVLVRPNRRSGNRTMVKTRLEVNAWCQNNVGAITQSDGTTDEFGVAVSYQFRDMRSDPVREVVGESSFHPLPTWTTSKRMLCRQNASYTLTSSTSVQKLFDASGNGRLTLPVGAYHFNCVYSLSSMSATSGNSAFSIAVGTATIGTILMQTVGADGVTATAASLTGSTAITSAFPASQHTAGVGTGQQTIISGSFEVTAAGTIIPSVQLVTAAAAVVAAGSFFECWYVGSNTVATVGTWD